MANAAEKFLLTHKDQFMWTVLITSDKLRPAPRVAHLCHSADIGFFYSAKSTTSKIAQIEKNPVGTISIYPGKGFSSVVAQVTLKVSAERKDLDAVWSDDLLKVGYTGKDDERLRAILVTVHHVTFGKESYEGVPIDPKIDEKIVKGDLPPLATGPFKTKEVDELIKNTFAQKKIGDLITFKGLGHDSRIVDFRFKDGVGLYSATNLGSKKAKEIRANANVALLVTDKKAWDQIIVDAVAHICTCPDLKKKVWEDSFKAFGFKGADDEQLALILYTPRRTVHHTMTAPPDELVAEPIKYDKDLQLMKGLSKLGDCFHLTTVDEHGVAHSRIMGALPFHPVLGYYIGCHAGSNKTIQLEHNSHAILTTYRDSTGDSYTVEAEIVTQTDKQILLATWSPLLAAVGYKGPEDTSRVVLQTNVTKAEYVNVKEFWAGLAQKK